MPYVIEFNMPAIKDKLDFLGHYLDLPDANGRLTITDTPTGPKRFYRLRGVEDASR